MCPMCSGMKYNSWLIYILSLPPSLSLPLSPPVSLSLPLFLSLFHPFLPSSLRVLLCKYHRCENGGWTRVHNVSCAQAFQVRSSNITSGPSEVWTSFSSYSIASCCIIYGWGCGKGRGYSRMRGCLVVNVVQFREHERRAEGAELC